MSEPKTLAKRRVPPIVWADRLETARRTDFLWVSSRGHVRSGDAARTTRVLSRIAALGLGAYATVGMVGTGPIGVALAVPFVGWMGLALLRGRRYLQGANLTAHERYEEAEVVLRRLIAAPLSSRGLRGPAYGSLITAVGGQGRHADALALVREGMPYLRGVFRTVAQLREVELLVTLGRIDEALKLFSTRHHAVPTGAYLLHCYWVTEMYLWMALDDAVPDDETLRERTRAALAVRTGAVLLGLLAWAYAKAGDAARAREMLDAAAEAESRGPIETTHPRLHAWMAAQR